MKLADYLTEKQIAPEAFGALVQQTGRAVESWLSGDRRPRWETLVRISEATGGAVTANDFLPEPEKQEAAE